MQSNSVLVENSTGSYYTDEQRLEAVTVFSAYGNIRKAAEHLKMPDRTLYDWSKQEWWHTQLTRLREENKDLIRAKVQKIVETGFDAIQDRITNGDTYLAKEKDENGVLVDVVKRKPASLRDLGTVTGISFDKLRLIDGEPTSIRSDSSQLQDLAAQFRQLVTKKVIDGEATTAPICEE